MNNTRPWPSGASVAFTPAAKKAAEDIPNITAKIDSYLRDLPPHVLGIQSIRSIQFLEMTPGSYNLNYHLRINDRDWIFRLNIDQQSGLSDQIEYEFNTIKFLEGHRIAPKVYHLDNTRTRFAFGILIEEYIAGPYISLVAEEMPEVAELLARLHSLPCDNASLIAWADPLVNNYEQVQGDLKAYEARRTSDPHLVRLSKKLLEHLEVGVRQSRHLFHMDSLNHTDLAIDNFIRTADGLRLIDWEKPRLDDCSYDLCCFLAAPPQLWCSPSLLSPEGRERLIHTYASHSGKSEELLIHKIRIREPLVSLHWVMWSATKLCDFREERTTSELMECHAERVERWERSSSVEIVEKLFELL